MPDQSGRTAVVTGANSGLGLVTARELARAGATVVMACRDRGRGERALADVAAAAPDAEVELERLDLARPRVRSRAGGEALRRAGADRPANQQRGRHGAPARRDRRRLRAPARHQPSWSLRAHGPAARAAARGAGSAGRHGHEPDAPGRPDRLRKPAAGAAATSAGLAYGQSKLANLLFARELQLRLTAAGADDDQHGRAPRLRGNPPAVDRPWRRRRPRRASLDRPVGGRQRGLRAERGDGRPAPALRRDGPRRARRRALRARPASTRCAVTRRWSDRPARAATWTSQRGCGTSRPSSPASTTRRSKRPQLRPERGQAKTAERLARWPGPLFLWVIGGRRSRSV